jgi:hypothetical protein
MMFGDFHLKTVSTTNYNFQSFQGCYLDARILSAMKLVQEKAGFELQIDNDRVDLEVRICSLFLHNLLKTHQTDQSDSKMPRVNDARLAQEY